jgi:flagellar hook-associated protein 2
MATSASSISGGSTLDARSLAAQLVAAERQPLDAQIKRATAGVTTTMSALGTLKSALSTFQVAVDKLSLLADFQVRTAVSSDETFFAARADETAIAGSYAVEVRSLAAAQQIASGAYAAGSAATVGSGTLTLAVGGASFDVRVQAGTTLAGLRDAINYSRDNTGITATIVQSSEGARLVLGSRATGAANTIEVTAGNAADGLDSLAYSAGAPGAYTQVTAAADAVVHFAGFEQSSATNTLTGVIDGVTLELKAAEEGRMLTLTVANDTATVRTRIETFVSTYNAMQTAISGLRSYDPVSGAGGPLLGDSMLLTLEASLRRGLTDAVDGLAGPYSSLAALGITTTADGTLTINDAKLDGAIAGGFDGVAQLFGKTGGIGFRLFNTLERALSSAGGIAVRTTALGEERQRLEERQANVDARMEAMLARYVQQFTTLDMLLSQLDTTSSYLDTQLDSLSRMLGRDK